MIAVLSLDLATLISANLLDLLVVHYPFLAKFGF